MARMVFRLPFAKRLNSRVVRCLLLCPALALLLWWTVRARHLLRPQARYTAGAGKLPSSCWASWTCSEVMRAHLAAQEPVQEVGGEFEDRCAYRTEHGRAVATLVPPAEARRIPKIVHFIFGLSDGGCGGGGGGGEFALPNIPFLSVVYSLESTGISSRAGLVGGATRCVQRAPPVPI